MPPPQGQRFKPGKSGNPGGRPQLPVEIRDLVRGHTHEAVAILVKGLKSESETMQFACAKELLDRGWGKPAQAITGEGGGPILVKIDDAWARSNPPK